MFTTVIGILSSLFAAINLECVPMDIDGDAESISSQFASMKLVEDPEDDEVFSLFDAINIGCIPMDIDEDYTNKWITVPIDIDEAVPMETEDNECVSMDIDEATSMDMEDWDYIDQYIIECMLMDPDL